MFNKPLIFLAGGLLILGAWFLYSREHSSQEEVSSPSSVSGEKSLAPLSRGVTTRSNSWFSSLYHGLPSAPLFVYPGAYQWQKEGLSIGVPHIVGTENTVFGSFDALCQVGNGKEIDRVKVVRYGDFDLVVKAQSEEGDWQAQFMEGSPLVRLSGLSSGLHLQCKEGIVIDKSTAGTWLVKQSGKNLFVVQAATPLSSEAESIFHSASGEFRIFHWPTMTEKSVNFFTNLPWNEVVDTQMRSETRGEIQTLRLALLTKENTASLMTIWPHHRLATTQSSEEILGSYETVLGRLDLVEEKEVRLEFSLVTLPTTFTPVSDPVYREKIITELKTDAVRYQSEAKPEGVYFGGTWLGGLATLIQLADTYDLTTERTVLLELLQKHLIESTSRFAYSEEKKMMVATNAEFGNEKGNDHHFHYGYFLRAAAVLLQFKPELGLELKPTMEELARDIATIDRTSTRFPYLRHFDVYAGHSWADGEARFADGNNQESTSEALNAWYALYLWSKTMGNTERENLSKALYTYELMGTRAYWFGENNPFPTGFEHRMASLVWGGKRDYATWFSGEAMHIHGIQWLPITPASEYLKTLPHFSERKAEVLRAHPNPAGHEWGDLYTATLSFAEPEEALRLLPEAQTKRAMKSTALLYHTVYSNLERKNTR